MKIVGTIMSTVRRCINWIATVLHMRARVTGEFNGRTNFADYANSWLEKRAAAGLKSEQDYRGVLDRYILPTFGERPLEEIRTLEIRDWVGSLRSSDLAPRTVLNVYAILRNVMSYAVADEVITRSPCQLRKNDLPKNVDKRPDFRALAQFSRDEVRRILDARGRIPFRWLVLYAALFLTGARVGEMLALRWERIDFGLTPLGRVLIAESYSSKNKRVGSTKTNIAREVPIHSTLEPFLREWHAEGYAKATGHEPAPSGLVFPRARSRVLSPMRSTVVLHRFHSDLERLGMRPRRIHDTRRTFVTLACAEDGASVDVLRRITHARPGDVHSAYREVSWEERCREISKLKV